MKTSTNACAALFSLVLAAGTAFGQQYTATMIPSLPGGFGTKAYGVNDSGTVVGQAGNAAGGFPAFIYMQGQTVELPMLEGSNEAIAFAVNNSDVAVGYSHNASGTWRAVKWHKQAGATEWTITDLGTLQADSTGGFGSAQRINDAGQIVGYSTRAQGGAYHATLWDAAGVATDLGTLGYSGNLAYSQGLGINNAGDVSGYAYRVLGGPEHGMFRNAGAEEGTDLTPPGQFGLAQWHNITDTGVLGGYVASPQLTQSHFVPAIYSRDNGYQLAPILDGLEDGFGWDINNSGVLVGRMFLLTEQGNLWKPFSFDGTTTVDLNLVTTGMTSPMLEARDISDSGLIVGFCEGLGVPEGVLLSPVAPTCPADLGGAGGVQGADGVLDNNDFIVFINLFFALESLADVGSAGGMPGGDHAWDNNDFIVFIGQFFDGCN